MKINKDPEEGNVEQLAGFRANFGFTVSRPPNLVMDVAWGWRRNTMRVKVRTPMGSSPWHCLQDPRSLREGLIWDLAVYFWDLGWEAHLRQVVGNLQHFSLLLIECGLRAAAGCGYLVGQCSLVFSGVASFTNSSSFTMNTVELLAGVATKAWVKVHTEAWDLPSTSLNTRLTLEKIMLSYWNHMS